MKIDIVSDVACPWCYVGKKNLEAAMAQRPDIEFEIQWFPYQLHPEAPSEGYDYQRTLEKKYGKERIAMMYQSFAEAGKKAGVDFHLDRIERGANTFLAHRLLEFAWSKGKQNELAEALFDAYFCQGLFVGDPKVLTEVAVTVGLDEQEVSDYLKSDEGVASVKEKVDAARSDGVSGVPSFSFNNMFAVQGGQPVEAFLHTIDRLHEKSLAENS
ncbi:MAG: DsbA family oxidoreductase [Pseudomonadales bacterium]|nr:DsbA family oxidoreductase [Pseudomonadales bacterium]